MNIFADIIKGKTVILGVGNTLKGDDGIGPAFVERIKGMVPAVCIDAGVTPENYTGPVAKEKPDTILIVDAAHLGLEPGSYEMLTTGDIARTGFTTHDASPAQFLEYLAERTGARICFLGVQPKSMKPGDEMSEPVRVALDVLARQLTEAYEA
jgi:hydrogenase 3 maturation protease